MDRIGGSNRSVSQLMTVHGLTPSTLGGLLLCQPKLQSPFLDMLAKRLWAFRITHWSRALNPKADQWQKGNAAMRVRRRVRLDLCRELRSS
jgi:hypothetical protein